MTPTTTGERIRKLRKERGLSRSLSWPKWPAQASSYIWELENKNPPRPSGEKLAAIATALGATADYLLGADDIVDKADAEDKAFYREYARVYLRKRNRSFVRWPNYSMAAEGSSR